MARLDAATERELLDWIERYRAEGGATHGQGYQGQTYLYQARDRRFIIKVAPGRRLFGAIARWMLRRE